MEHLIPTLLGIAGALAPVVLSYWRQESPDVAFRHGHASRLAPVKVRSLPTDALIRGGRVYL